MLFDFTNINKTKHLREDIDEINQAKIQNQLRVCICEISLNITIG